MAKKTATVSKTKDVWNIPSPKAEVSSDEVVTKPNQSMSIRDILFRNTAGMTYDNYKTPYYEDQATFSSESLNKIQEMEPVEKLQYLQEVQEKVTNLKTKIQVFEAEKQAKIDQQQADANAQANAVASEDIVTGTE
jgi:adenine-specific DNA glycosylase